MREAGHVFAERRVVYLDELARMGRIQLRAQVVLGARLEGDVGESRTAGRPEDVEYVGEHGRVHGDVFFLRLANLKGHPEDVGDLAGDGRELQRRVVGARGVEGDVAVDGGGWEPAWHGAASGAVDFPRAAEGVGAL